MDGLDRSAAAFADDAASSMFLMMPHEASGQFGAVVDRHADAEHNRLLIWVAIGLAAVSIVGGMLYYVYYLRVGNAVTALLPRDTVAYVRVGPAARLQDAFTSLQMWQTTRPVRDRFNRHERRVLQRVLLDIGLSVGALQQLKSGLTNLHVAAITPEHQIAGRLPYDLLFFLEFRADADRTRLLDTIAPAFQQKFEEKGVEFYVRRVGMHTLSLSWFDDLVVLGWGSDGGMREVLRNRDQGPNRSLNDADGFRTAYRAHAHEPDTDIWAYVRHDQFVDLSLTRLLAPMLVEEQRRAIMPYITRLREADVEGAGVAIKLRNGTDSGNFGFYPGTADGFAELAAQTGAHPMSTLSAIPGDALLTIAGTLDNPTALLSQWRGPLLRMLTDLGFFDSSDNPDSGINRLQAESGVYLTADVWPVFARELALAYLPTEGSDELTWLMVFRVHNTSRAMDVISRVAKHVYRDERGRYFQRRYPLGYDNALYRITAVKERPDGQGGMEIVSRREVLCWADTGSKVLLAPTCDPVERGRAAETYATGLDKRAEEALSGMPDRSTLLAVGRLRPLLERLTGDHAVLELLRDDFMVATSVAVHPDRVELTANVSALSLGFLWATGIYDTDAAPTSDPCKKLVGQVCGDDMTSANCLVWRAKVEGSSPQACRTGLRTIQSFDAATMDSP